MDMLIIIGVLIILGVLLTFAFLFLKKLLNSDKTLPFKLKRFFFTRSEQEFFNILKSKIDYSKYCIFPKVRLCDFVETIKNNKIGDWNKIRSKHIDFLIWDIEKSMIILAIEIDGKSHLNKRSQINDNFKDILYKDIGLILKRIKVGSDFVSEVSKILDELDSNN